MDTSIGQIEISDTNIDVCFDTIDELLEIIKDYDKELISGTIKIYKKNEFFVFCKAEKTAVISTVINGDMFKIND